MKAGYGEPLRRFFAETAWTESVIDFGHAKQIFEDAGVFPSIIVLRKPTDEPKPQTIRVGAIPRETLRVDDLSQQIADEGFEVAASKLGADGWQIEPSGAASLFAKIGERGTPLATEPAEPEAARPDHAGLGRARRGSQKVARQIQTTDRHRGQRLQHTLANGANCVVCCQLTSRRR